MERSTLIWDVPMSDGRRLLYVQLSAQMSALWQMSALCADGCFMYSLVHYVSGVGGVNGDGDIYRPENLLEFQAFVMRSTQNRGIHFIMGDGVRILVNSAQALRLQSIQKEIKTVFSSYLFSNFSFRKNEAITL